VKEKKNNPVKKHQRKSQSGKTSEGKKSSLNIWLILSVVITAICFSPMLKNVFTNWDDEHYVIDNMLLRGPDWKGIFSQPVVSNYHPLTILSLAFNYQLAKLVPYSYFLVNLMLHLINTILVYFFIWSISGKKIWVAAISSLLFGIHPMHVESVAWISERKDVLYTLFFLWSLIQYWKYITEGKSKHFWISFLLFILSLLSKPAAIILPVVLLLLDYWKGRPMSKNIFIEKIPFFILSLVFAIATLKIQSQHAVAGLEIFPASTRIFFACYVVMIYLIRFIIPSPLSTFHPYPSPENLGMPVLLSPLFIIALTAFLWYNRKNKMVVFGILFFVANLLLVLQIVSFGNTIISERYTYVPYIGLAFLLGMLLDQSVKKFGKKLVTGVFVFVAAAFGSMTYARTQVWKDSGTLWTDVISHYPFTPVPRTNRSNYTYKKALTVKDANEKNIMFQQVLDDCTIALKADPKHARAYEDRGALYLNLNKDSLALADGDSLVKIDPGNRLGYSIRGTAYQRLNQLDKAVDDFTKCISLFPDHDFAYVNRGTVLFSQAKYKEALNDYSKAISINPAGSYYLNRSFCYFKLGDLANAKADMEVALQKGENVSAEYQNAFK
jgi:tetratricopeptide (TPR) repeat protein